MSIAKFIAKSGASVAGASLVAMSLVAAVPAAAQTTTTDYAAQIAALQAQIASLQALLAASQGGTTTSASVTFTRDLTIGATGSDVTALQTWLISKGYSIPAGATGYFGTQTQAALAAYQAANGISPAAGYFGPITRAKVNASGSTTTTGGGTTTGGSTTGTLSGGEGSIDNFKVVGATNSSLNAADSQTVYGFEFKADGSDLQVNRVDYDVYLNDNSGTTHPWSIFQTATLMDGNTTIGTVDASNMNNWSQDGTDSTTGNQIYRIRFDNLKDIVKMGNTADYYLKLSTQSAISDSNIGTSPATWAISLASQGVRATDAMGLQQYSPSGTSYNSLSIANSTTGSAVISTGSDNPQATTVQGNSSSQTSGVVLTTFTIQAKDSNLTVYNIPATVATTGTTANNLVRDFKLYEGSTLIDTESIGAGASNNFSFKNLNVTIPSGSTQSFSVQADINNIDGTTVPEGSSVGVSIGTNGSWDIENPSGDQVSITGSVTGSAITFRTVGLSFDTNPTITTNVTSNASTGVQTGTFNFTFNVTSFGQDIYVSSTTNGFVATLYDSAGNSTTTSASSITSQADKSGLGNYVVHSGQSKQFTISLTHIGGNGYVYGSIGSIKFGTTDANPLASTMNMTSNYQSGQLYIGG